ncbi:transposable element Tcb2 transposase [Trichonephila clavipes]|nr:transposable element Tcb2 transposase [Trichonephila clavipes]
MASQFRENSLRNSCLTLIQLSFDYRHRRIGIGGSVSAFYAAGGIKCHPTAIVVNDADCGVVRTRFESWRRHGYESRFNLRDHDSRISIRRNAGELCRLECVIKRLSGLTPGVMVWALISYHGQSNLLLIEGYLNSNSQHMKLLLPWPAYLPDMSPTDHVWDLVGRHLARDSRPAASKDELLLSIHSLWNSLPQVDI